MTKGLSKEQIEQFGAEGYLKLDRQFDEKEVAIMRAESERIFADSSLADIANLRAYTRNTLSGEPVIDRFDPVRDLSPQFDALSRDKRMIAAAADLLGEDVLLFKDKLIAKFPGVCGYSLHQDFAYWQGVGIPAEDIITAYISIDKAGADNGAMELFLGYHDIVFNRPGKMDDIEEDRIDTSNALLLETEPGDVVFFHTLVPHRSGPNRSDRHRRYLYFSYSPARHGDLYDRYYETYRERRLRELPGDLRDRAYFR